MARARALARALAWAIRLRAILAAPRARARPVSAASFSRRRLIKMDPTSASIGTALNNRKPTDSRGMRPTGCILPRSALMCLMSWARLSIVIPGGK